MSAPTARQVGVRFRAERVVSHPVGAAGLAHHAHVGGAAGLADLLEFQYRATGAWGTAVGVLLPGEVVEMARCARYEESGGHRAGTAVVASLVDVAGLVGPENGDVELEASAVDGREQVALSAAQPPREWMHRHTDAGPLIEGARGLLLPRRCAELCDAVASRHLAHRSDQAGLQDPLGVVDVPQVDT